MAAKQDLKLTFGEKALGVLAAAALLVIGTGYAAAEIAADKPITTGVKLGF